MQRRATHETRRHFSGEFNPWGSPAPRQKDRLPLIATMATRAMAIGQAKKPRETGPAAEWRLHRLQKNHQPDTTQRAAQLLMAGYSARGDGDLYGIPHFLQTAVWYMMMHINYIYRMETLMA